MSKNVLLIALPLFAAVTAVAQPVDVPEGGSFYGRDEEGWFWYETFPEIVEEEPEETKKAEAIPVPQAPPGPPPEVAESTRSEGPDAFSVAWIKAKLPEYLNAAIDNPTPENVRAYYYLQRLMMDKAERFSAAAKQVVTGDPLLDETNRYPTAGFATSRRDDAARAARDELTKKLAASSGLFFFFDGLCAECGQQAYVLKQLSDLHGVKSKAISMDGSKVDEKFFPEILDDAGQAAALGVERTPAIVFVSPAKGVVEPIAQGHLLAIPQIQERMLAAAKRYALLPANEVDRANPVQGLDDLLDPSPFGVTPEMLDDPVRLVEYLRTSK